MPLNRVLVSLWCINIKMMQAAQYSYLVQHFCSHHACILQVHFSKTHTADGARWANNNDERGPHSGRKRDILIEQHLPDTLGICEHWCYVLLRALHIIYEHVSNFQATGWCARNLIAGALLLVRLNFAVERWTLRSLLLSFSRLGSAR